MCGILTNNFHGLEGERSTEKILSNMNNYLNFLKFALALIVFSGRGNKRKNGSNHPLQEVKDLQDQECPILKTLQLVLKSLSL